MTLSAIGVSTGRAGSTYIATVLNLAGVPTLHETHFNGRRCIADGDVAVWDHDELAEWSAQAVPYLHLFPDVQVWHQVRHPLKTVGSLYGFKLFHLPHTFGLEGKVIFDRFTLTGDPLTDAVRYWVDWNLRCEQARRYRRWRLEDVDEQLIVTLAADVGLHIHRADARQALDQVPTDTNSKHNAATFQWEDLPDIPATGELVAAARRYGYEVP